ncbi:hypothetical protein FSP39_007008 [Pinctada imbricata]|uniref:Tripartite motif-containing protein 2 n=1 Tax=Pinctada imbricata TaxID=66713 RepID=A0AA88XJJ3_PINIB|nr:hypothetical protein FSP39_007008 [Pinctada imbricata]
MVDIKGQVLRRRNIQKKPYAMAVMDCGDVILSSNVQYSGLVSRLLGDGREQHVFDTSPSYCNGVSVTADGKMLICTCDGRVVMVNVDGTKMKQIYKGSGNDSARHAVEDAVSNIYISDYLNYAVVKINKDGKFSSKITNTTGGQHLGRPSGLVVDTMNNILCADSYKHCVYIIDQNQQMRELVGRSHGIKHPQWLAVDCENNLWITQGDENVFVVRYLST